MDLSIIIVNFNVKFFLEQCLVSVIKAIQNIDAEIIVVDNNSVDGSQAMIKEKFPFVVLFENNTNEGFSKANNRALAVARGRYCLLLNPDTLVEEKTFHKCIKFMDQHHEAGALGVKMINGKGKYLPESKRSLPTPATAFYKIFGLSYIFPRSKIFGKYNLSYLDNDAINEVDIISGAFMFIRKEALTKTGLLDESFFMYGEDIDISYRIKKAGYKNYYFPETTIIHYKGESTKKGSLNYVILFYKAMIIFYKKHYAKKNFMIFPLLIYMAIYFRAAISVIRRFLHAIYQPAIDGLLIYFSFIILSSIWEKYYFGLSNYFPKIYLNIHIPAYVFILLCTIYLSGGYEKPVKLKKLIKGYFSGTVILLIIYALLPENLRFSRVVLISGTISGLFFVLAHRLLLGFLKCKDYEHSGGKIKRIIIAGNADEVDRVAKIVYSINQNSQIIGFLSESYSTGTNITYIGNTRKLKETISVNHIDEVIFCAKNIPSDEIIRHMNMLSELKVDFKIAPSENSLLIGSNSINFTGDYYIVPFKSISKALNNQNE